MKHLSIFIFSIAATVFSAFNVANATVFAIDDFNIVKNGNNIFNDPFNDGNPPPSSGGSFPSGAPGSYLTKGTPTESNGRVYLDTALGEIGSSPLNGVPVSVQRSRLITNKNNANLTNGLKIDDTFIVSGLFDFIAPDAGERYSIRLADWDDPAGVVDVVEMGLQRSTSGDVIAQFSKYDFDLGIRDALTTWNLTNFFNSSIYDINAYDQIEFFLAKGSATSSTIHAHFNMYDYDAGAGATISGSGGGTADIFTVNNFTRAEFIAINTNVTDVPEPATILLMGLGLAGLGFARHRKI